MALRNLMFMLGIINVMFKPVSSLYHYKSQNDMLVFMNIIEQFQDIPEQLRATVEQQWSSFTEKEVDTSSLPDEIITSLAKVWACSEFVMLTCVRNPSVFMELGSGYWDAESESALRSAMDKQKEELEQP